MRGEEGDRQEASQLSLFRRATLHLLSLLGGATLLLLSLLGGSTLLLLLVITALSVA
jgi:hypothetical protein